MTTFGFRFEAISADPLGVIEVCVRVVVPSPYPSPMGPNTLFNKGVGGTHFGEFGRYFDEFGRYFGELGRYFGEFGNHFGEIVNHRAGARTRAYAGGPTRAGLRERAYAGRPARAGKGRRSGPGL